MHQQQRQRRQEGDAQQRRAVAVEQVLGKNLPATIEAERAILGALILNDDNFAVVSEVLVADDFYSHAHRIIFSTIALLLEQRRRVDLITLQDELTKRGELEAVGGVVYLVSLQEDIAAIGLVEQHARLVKEKSVLRELISSATSIITRCYAQDDREIEAVLDEAEQTIFSIANKRTRANFQQLDIWLRRTLQQVSETKSQRSGVTGVPSGYSKLDELTSGLQKGDFIVLAARPSVGKTALALRIAQNASQAGAAVGFFSLEMSAEQLTLRLLSSESRIRHHVIRNATLSSDEWIDLTHAATRLAEARFFIDDTPSQTIMDVRTKARKLRLEQKVQLIVIDYLQLLTSSGWHENRHQEVSTISRALKALAKELGIPIIALSQLSRAVDSRVDKRPMLSDLRESGAIEQDADLIMFLYRDVLYNPDTADPNLAELIIGKQRNGPTGTVYLNFIRELTTFEDAPDRE
ncbi:MAG: Primary replicative DNA helicase [candidate division TM6 bacterium GW2011_GWE2_42_60]|nr:MAG: Primary replicative DNA helicase [candidate division TM6 bacterium GW2011_GWE2_42_60]HBY06188.1 replicative DNA helicase [Candidatus Dependentiae bacterium]